MDARATRLCFLIAVTIPLLAAGQSGTLITSLSCDFESADICNFTQSIKDDFNWTRHQGATPTDNTGPTVDHTTGSPAGYYMYADATVPQSEGDQCVLTSPAFSGNSWERCLEFYYNMHGLRVGALEVQTLNLDDWEATPQQVWRISGEQDEPWHRALVNLNPGSNNFSIIFEATIGSHHQGDIAIDDIRVTHGVCPHVKLNCDFQDPMRCGYFNDYTADTYFVRRAGNTPSSFTGPTVDHTYGNATGYYMHMEASSQRQGMTAGLISPVIAGTENGINCLIFWFHMYGESIDTLYIYTKNIGDIHIGDPLWKLSGNRGNLWRAAEVPLNSTTDYQLVIRTRSSGGYLGDIAFDDVRITGEVCPGEYVYTNTSGVTCTFESADICYYTQDTTDDADWSWQNSATRDGYTGPNVDHTLGNSLGFYLVFAGDPGNPGKSVARLISPGIPPTSATSCVVFWYHMYGDDVETLNVYVVSASYTELPDNPDWTTSGNQGDYWHRATVTFPRSTRQNKIIFEARNGRLERDDVALDDVELFENRACPTFTTDAPPPTTRPIPVNDISCDFENDFCDYRQATDDLFDWTRQLGPSRSFGSGPDVDHTLGTDQGSYALMDCYNNELRFDDRTRLESPLLVASPSSRCLKFYYYKFSTNVKNQDFLNVYLKEWGHRLGFDPNWVVFGLTGPEWIEARVNIPPSDNPIQVVFEASIAIYRYNCDIAMDDITLEDGACPDGPAGPTYVDSVSCDFEDNEDPLCGFTQENLDLIYDDTIDWTIGTGPTSTDETGPENDHTYGTSEGHYLYIESSQPQRPGDMASLTSPLIRASHDHMCLEFYYHMSGIDTAFVRVTLTKENENSEELARLSGQGEEDWRPMLVDVPPFRGGMQLSFYGTVGQGFRGDIAIDDIRTLREPCGGFPTDSYCTFEFGFDECMYDFMATGGSSRWIWFDKYTDGSPITGGDGSYMYTATDSGEKIATIYSNSFKLSLQHCIIFMYSISGSTGSLQVDLVHSNDTSITLGTMSDDTLGEWSVFATQVERMQGGHAKIRFIGTTSDGAAIAVDTVGMLGGNCNYFADRYGLEPTKEPVEQSKAGLLIGIIIAILVVLALLVGLALFLRSRGVGSDMKFHFDNGNEPKVTSDKALSADPGIDNPNYSQANLSTA